MSGLPPLHPGKPAGAHPPKRTTVARRRVTPVPKLGTSLEIIGGKLVAGEPLSKLQEQKLVRTLQEGRLPPDTQLWEPGATQPGDWSDFSFPEPYESERLTEEQVNQLLRERERRLQAKAQGEGYQLRRTAGRFPALWTGVLHPDSYREARRLAPPVTRRSGSGAASSAKRRQRAVLDLVSSAAIPMADKAAPGPETLALLEAARQREQQEIDAAFAGLLSGTELDPTRKTTAKRGGRFRKRKKTIKRSRKKHTLKNHKWRDLSGSHSLRRRRS